jgi:hypothetical protein
VLVGICLFGVAAIGQSCQETTVNGYIKGGEGFSLAIGSGFEIRLVPMRDNWGWQVEAGPSDSSADWAWVTNPPYHSSNAQYMGTGYGENARDRLKHAHEVRFVLKQSEFERLLKLVEEEQRNADAAGPLLTALSEAETGSAIVIPTEYDKAGDPQQVRWMRFSLKVNVPTSFERSKALKWMKAACPSRMP